MCASLAEACFRRSPDRLASAGQPTAATNPGNGSGGGGVPAATWALTIVLFERAPAAIVPGPAIGAAGVDPEPGGLGPSAATCASCVEGIERDAVEDRQVLGEHGVRSHRLNHAAGRVGCGHDRLVPCPSDVRVTIVTAGPPGDPTVAPLPNDDDDARGPPRPSGAARHLVHPAYAI